MCTGVATGEYVVQRLSRLSDSGQARASMPMIRVTIEMLARRLTRLNPLTFR
jgi:hypothetical protein